MSSSRAADGIPGGVRRSYISTQPFSSNFYSYTSNVWGSVAGANTTTCPAGRILRETGKKLYPGTAPFIDQYYVGVYDAVSLLKGFIDPNNAIFAPFNSDKPVYVGDSKDDFTNKTVNDSGAPVITNGSVFVNGLPGKNQIAIGNEVNGGNGAYMYLETPSEPHIGVFTSTIADAYLKTYYDGAELTLQAAEGTSNATFVYASTEANTAEIDVYTSSIQGSAKIKVYNGENHSDGVISLYTGYSSAIWGNGDIALTGLVHPARSCGTITLSPFVAPPAAACGTASNNLLQKSDVLVLLTRQNVSGTPGHLYYTVNDSTITVCSTEAETSVINYFLISSNPATH
jgi:hypothetical protein